MKLKDCTKEELIFIIDRLKRYAFSQGDYYLQQCLRDLEYERQKKKLDEADKWSEIANQKRAAYIELLKQYENTKVTEIPPEILEEAQKLLQEADKADKKYWQLTSIS